MTNKLLQYQIKDHWQELSKKQVRYIAKHWSKWQGILKALSQTPSPINENILAEQLHYEKVRLMIVLSDLKGWSKRQERKLFFNYSDKDLVRDAQNINFIFDKIELTTNYYPRLILPFSIYHAPKSIYKLTGIEFAFAEKCFYDYMTNGHTDDLNMLIAILYRKNAKKNHPSSLSYSGDIREPFNQHSVDYRQNKMWMLSKTKKMCILLWYSGSRQVLIDRYKDTVFAPSTSGKPLEYGLLSVFRELAGRDITKQLKVEKTPISVILMNLHESIKESRKKQ